MAHHLEDLEAELISRLYALRDHERQILAYSPQTSAPAELREAYRSAKLDVQQLEVMIRRIRHGF